MTPVAEIMNNNTCTEYSLADALGSIIALTDETGTIKTQYNYSPFGDTEVIGTDAAGLGQPFRYTGREWDGATGLYYYRARYYSPAMGRFISEDPIGLAGGDVNYYAYVWNDPINWSDPSGLTPAGVIIKLTRKAFKKIKKIKDISRLKKERKRKQEVHAPRRQVAKQVERANAGGKPVKKHKGHKLPDGEKGMPHYQTPGKKGHTFWTTSLIILADIFNPDPFDAIAGELSPDNFELCLAGYEEYCDYELHPELGPCNDM